MATTWSITALYVKKQENNLTDVVYNVAWLAQDTDGTYTAQEGGETEMPPPGDPFVPYPNLTEAEVIGWVQSVLGAQKVAAIEAGLAAQIAYMANPPIDAPPLPWS
jgi:predicted phage tail protein